MQKDFIDGALGTKEAVAIVDNVKKKIAEYKENGDEIIFTRDTHQADYLDTNEGKHLPVEYCIEGTEGWELGAGLAVDASCCAGVTPESHEAALLTMKMCQIEVK